jgi:hypothetical protein
LTYITIKVIGKQTSKPSVYPEIKESTPPKESKVAKLFPDHIQDRT